MKLLVLAFVFSLSRSFGADLDELYATQQKLIAARDSDKLPRDEVPLPEVALAKRQLLTWTESRLQTFANNANPDEMTQELNRELHRVISSIAQDDLDRLGDLDIAFSRPKGEPTWIQMNTDIGIQCGYDRSVYLYEWRDQRWNRRFALEANDYRKTEYSPQQEFELEMSTRDARGARYILTTGLPPACISVWHPLYIRLFRIDEYESQKLLLSETPLANLGQDGPAYSAHLENKAALIEFFGSSIDSGFLIRKHVLHFTFKGDKVRRIDPIAFSPRDFVDEWLTRPWTEVAAWTESGLAQWHERLHKEFVEGEYDAVQTCKRRGERQVSINIRDKLYYFSVRDQGQDRLRMIDIGENPRGDCSGQDELSGH